MIALAIAAVLGTSAHAQVSGYSEGDLLIGFEQQDGKGDGGVNANDFVVDLGGANNFINATSKLTFNLSTTSSGLGVFGTNWASNTAVGAGGASALVQWGVVGGSDKFGPITVGTGPTAVTLPVDTLFYTQGELNVGTQSTPPATGSTGAQGNIDGKIQTFANDFQGANTTSAGAIIGTSDPDSWSTLGTPSTSAFGSSKNIEQPSSGSFTGPTNSQLDLYELNTSSNHAPATLLGNFSLTSLGVLTFNPAAAAVPEPTSYALALVAAATFLVLRRRKALSA